MAEDATPGTTDADPVADPAAATPAADPWAPIHEGRQPDQVRQALAFVDQVQQAGGLDAIVDGHSKQAATDLAVEQVERLLSTTQGQAYLRERLGIKGSDEPEEELDPVQKELRDLKAQIAELKQHGTTTGRLAEETQLETRAIAQRERVTGEFSAYINENPDLQEVAPRMWADIREMIQAAPQHFLKTGAVKQAAAAWVRQIEEAAPLLAKRASRATRVSPGGGGGGSPQKSPADMDREELRRETYRQLNIE